jgi:hypothetical protein
VQSRAATVHVSRRLPRVRDWVASMTDDASTPAKPAVLSDCLLLKLFFGSVLVGVVFGALLGDPTQWSDTTPLWLALTSGCVGAAYLLVASWKDELEDRKTVELMMRLVKLGAPGVVFGATLVSAAWTVATVGTRGSPGCRYRCCRLFLQCW